MGTFRSTGSYEPDLHTGTVRPAVPCFDPQALTSLTNIESRTGGGAWRFDPQALTSLTRNIDELSSDYCSFDPQALTSLTNIDMLIIDELEVSIHRLLRA